MARKIKIVGFKNIEKKEVKDGVWIVRVYKKANDTFLIDDRKHWTKNGELLPTKKGITLPYEDVKWHILGLLRSMLFIKKFNKEDISSIDEIIRIVEESLE